MLTIKTKPDCTLGFLNVISESLTEEQIINGINLAKATEEQARELVEEGPSKGGAMVYKIYPPIVNKEFFFHGGDLKFRPYYINGKKPPQYLRAVHSLFSAAESLGIEEKDFGNYLVIKL